MSKQKNNESYFWNAIKGNFLKTLAYFTLTVGTIQAITGSFKGIPYLAETLAKILYPIIQAVLAPNLIAYLGAILAPIAPYIIPTLIALAVISGATNFWGSFEEPLLSLFMGFSKKESTSISKEIDDLKQNIATLKEKNIARKTLCRTRLDRIQLHLTRDEYARLSKNIEEIEKLISELPADPKPLKKDPTWFDTFWNATNKVVNGFSWTVLVVGSGVMLGMGVLTNQACMKYFEMPLTGFTLGVAFFGSLLSTISKLSFSAPKQARVLPRMCGLEKTTQELNLEKKASLSRLVEHQQHIGKKALQDIEAKLTQAETTVDTARVKDIRARERHKLKPALLVAQPILFAREHIKIVQEHNQELEAIKQQAKAEAESKGFHYAADVLAPIPVDNSLLDDAIGLTAVNARAGL